MAGWKYRQPSWKKTKSRASPFFKATIPTNTKAIGSPANGTQSIRRSSLSIPTGKQDTLTDRLIDLGEDAETVGPKGPKGFHLASFVPKVDGLYQVLARQVRTVQQGDGPKLLTLRLAKTAFAAFKVPTVSAAK